MSRKIKVLHVLKSSVYSGAENVVITIFKYLHNNYELVYAATDGGIRSVLEQENINYILFDKFSVNNIRKVIRDFDPDIVHAHDFTATVICSSIGGRFYLISHLHYDPPWVKKWNFKTLVYTLSGNRISKILSVSSKSFENMVFANLFRQKYINVKNPIDVDRILTMANLDNTGEWYDLLFVGRLVEQKNPKRFIKIVNDLIKSGFSIKCGMLGVGDLWRECEQLIKSYGLQEQIHLLGFQKNPYKYMKAAKILCLTSKWEGYGLVVAEANIVGTPVLSSYTSGVVEILGDKAVELCSTDEEFVSKIKTLLYDEKEYTEWRKATKRRAHKFLNVDVYIRSIDRIYQNLL